MSQERGAWLGYCLGLAGRRTQAVKGTVCKTVMQRFESARRLQPCCVPAKKQLGAVAKW